MSVRTLFAGALMAAALLAVPAFAAAVSDAPVKAKPGYPRFSLQLSAPQTVPAAASPRVEAEGFSPLPPVDITGPTRSGALR